MTDENPKLRVRMYRQGLGDCYLLTFFNVKSENNGIETEKDVHMLIDCGTLAAGVSGVTLNQVIDDILEVTKNQLDLLVVTHEHWDHVSGFSGKKTEKWKKLTVSNVWVAWTENPDDMLARDISKYKDDLLVASKFAVQILSNNQSLYEPEKQAIQSSASAIRELLRFELGMDQETSWNDLKKAGVGGDVNRAMRFASERAGWPPTFLEPGSVYSPAWLYGWRFYVMGPPRDPTDLRKEGGTKPEDNIYQDHHLQAAHLSVNADYFGSTLSMDQYRKGLSTEARQKFDAGMPFDARFRVGKSKRSAYKRLRKAYERDDWRCIDYDWLASAEDFALQLDNITNNTSVVLAIECVEDERVLLFPGDAQLGNWESWDKLAFKNEGEETILPKKTKDLLHQTVFYKVGHHASHNATMKVNGLDEMGTPGGRPDLVAVISVDSGAASKKGAEDAHWNMPAPALYKALLEKTKGRVLRSDVGWPGKEDNQRPPLWDDSSWNEILELLKCKTLVTPVEEEIELEPNPKGDEKIKILKYCRKNYKDKEGLYKIEGPQGYYFKDKEGNEQYFENGLFIDYLLY